MNTIGEKIAYVRDLRNIKQKELAEAIGVTKATMSKYENNINIPNADILVKMAEALNTSTDYLTGRTNRITPYTSTPEQYSAQKLFISDAGGRNFDGSPRYPSRFIPDIDKNLLEYTKEPKKGLIEEAEKPHPNCPGWGFKH